MTRYVGRGPNLNEFSRKLDRYARSWVVASTCRSGPELRAVETSLREFYEGIRLKLRLVPPTAEEKERLAKSIGKQWDSETSEENYPTLGAITMEEFMEAMILRFRRLLRENPEQADALRALQLLASAGVLPFTHRRLQAVLERIFQRHDAHLHDCLRVLAEQSFLQSEATQDAIQPEPAYLRDAVTYTEGKNPEDDWDMLADVLEDIGDYEGLVHLGETHILFLQDDSRALAYIDRSIELNPDYLDAWCIRSWALNRLGQSQEALEASEKALGLNPDLLQLGLLRVRR